MTTDFDFKIFKKALVKYEKDKDTNKIKIEIGDCQHAKTFLESGTTICEDCGEEIKHKMIHGKKFVDSSRVQARKSDEKSIYKDVENLGFSEKTLIKANKMYAQITNGKIFRGNRRKGIVFACVFHTLKREGQPMSHDHLINIFSLNRKIGLSGLKYVSLNAPKEANIRTTYITPLHLIDEIMDQFPAREEQLKDTYKKEVKELYTQIHNKSSKLNRSRPKSVASSLVYYWICKTKKNISLKHFIEKVGLSELTITKIAKEIATVLKTPDII